MGLGVVEREGRERNRIYQLYNNVEGSKMLLVAGS